LNIENEGTLNLFAGGNAYSSDGIVIDI
jgi:hypothetical protein